jgi:hypothetical protein
MDAAYKSLSNKGQEEDEVYMEGYPTTDAGWVARHLQPAYPG